MTFFLCLLLQISERSEQNLNFCAKNEHYEFAIFGAKIQIFEKWASQTKTFLINKLKFYQYIFGAKIQVFHNFTIENFWRENSNICKMHIKAFDPIT